MKLSAQILLLASALFSTAAYGQEFSAWSAPVNLGPTANIGQLFEQGPALSADGLSLYYHGGPQTPGGFGGPDLYVIQRASVNDPWGPPQNLGSKINSPFTEAAAMLSHDGHHLYFHSDRPGGFGASDIWMSRRHNKRDDFSWQPPLNLGPGVNSRYGEQQPCFFEDEATGRTFVYFSSNRPGGMGGNDIYVSELQPDETFGPAVLVAELSSPSEDNGVTIRRDGLELIFTSNRPGGFGYDDLWVATRQSTMDPWSEPVNAGPVVNSWAIDRAPELSFDGTTLYFNGPVPAGSPNTHLDLWMSTRTKLTGRGQE